jgi:TPR repeat protein
MLPSTEIGQSFTACCGKMVCLGCFYQQQLEHKHNHQNRSPTCLFCRAAIPIDKEYNQLLEKRVNSNDAKATQLGMMYLHGDHDRGVKKDLRKAIKLLHRAAELGCVPSNANLADLHYKGDGVSKDKKKAMQYYEKAAMAGAVVLRFYLWAITELELDVLIELLSTG